MLFNPCASISRKLSACLDGELSGSELADIKKHADTCPSCAGELRRLAVVDTVMQQLPAAEPARFFTARVIASARVGGKYQNPLHRFLRVPVPAMALILSFILINLFTFAFNINAMENGMRRELARKIVAQLAKPASMINPVALSRLCGECDKYMCLCMHEAGKESICPCKNCRMKNMEKNNVH